jgi:hypothetical protein
MAFVDSDSTNNATGSATSNRPVVTNGLIVGYQFDCVTRRAQDGDMRMGAILTVAVLLLIAVPRAARAQCSAFSVGGACAGSGKPTFHLDFRAQKDTLQKPVQPLNHSVNPVPPVMAGSNPVDCGMIKRVDPQFKSVMPIVKPDPKVQFPMKTLQPSACKR